MVEISTPPFSNQNQIAEDIILPFIIEISNINGRAARLSSSITTILNQHQYPLLIANILAEQLILTAILGASLEENHKVSIQIKNSSPIELLTTDITTNGMLRGYASYNAEQLPKTTDISAQNQLLKDASMVVIVENLKKNTTNQSIIKIENESLTSSFEQYFKQSKQIKVRIKSHIEHNKEQKSWTAGCILLEFLPKNNTDNNESLELEKEWWERASTYLETITTTELITPSLPLKELLYRLFHEDGVRIFAPKNIYNGCSCSREKILSFLKSIPTETLETMEIKKKIAITCEFCATEEVFTKEDLQT